MDWSLDAALVGRLGWAALLGLLVGAERERAGHAAGLRTFGAVALGAAAFGVISTRGFVHEADLPFLRWDPSRVAAQVVVGVGFLGAGVLIRAGETVKNLTTAAALWATAAVGLAAGAGLAGVAGLTAVLTLVVLGGVPAAVSGLHRTGRRVTARLRCQLAPGAAPALVDDVVRAAGLEARSRELFKRDGSIVVDLLVRAPTEEAMDAAIAELVTHDGVQTLDIVR